MFLTLWHSIAAAIFLLAISILVYKTETDISASTPPRLSPWPSVRDRRRPTATLTGVDGPYALALDGGGIDNN